MRAFITLFFSFLLAITLSSVHANNNLTELEQELSDSVITTKIKAKLTKSTELNPLKISVSTVAGVVTLKGHVRNNQALVDTLNLTKNTKGVKAVEADDLLVKQVNSSFTDAYITAKVEAAVLRAKVFDDESIPLVGINATTSNGTVTLSGKVKKDKSVVAIIKRVSALNGVKKIISRLEVNKINVIAPGNVESLEKVQF